MRTKFFEFIKQKFSNQFEQDYYMALFIVYETITEEKPYGFITQEDGFAILKNINQGDSRRFTYDYCTQLSRELGLIKKDLKPFRELNYEKIWMLTDSGMKKIKELIDEFNAKKNDSGYTKDDVEKIINETAYETAKNTAQQIREINLPRDARKILIMGYSQINHDDIKNLAEQFDIKDEMEFIFKKKLKKIKLKNIRPERYKYVIVGPINHNVCGFPDVLKEFRENKDMYPDVIELRNNAGALEINRESLAKAFNQISAAKSL